MKILVIGASGFLGKAILAELNKYSKFEVIATANKRCGQLYHKLDVLDHNSMKAFLNDKRPHVIVYLAAEKRPEICELNPSLAEAINVDAIARIAKIVNSSTWIIYISTDYVFDGKNAPYKPSDKPNPLNKYGKSKADGEQALWSVTKNSCVLRLPLLYGHSHFPQESIITNIANDLIANKDKLSFDHWAIRYPTYTRDVAIVCRQMIQQKIKDPSFNGTFHWASNEPYTKYEIAMLIAKLLNRDVDITPVKTQSSTLLKPYDCHLDCSDLDNLNIGSKTSFIKGVRDILSGI